jgi:serine/threonine-protein kinase
VVEPGRRCLGDRYELHQLIAAGGMGQVWRGHDIALHRTVAVKVLRSEYTGDPTFVARFRGEAQHAAALSHPNIAAVFDYGEEIAQDGTGETLAYLVMELVEGEPLSTLLAREGRLDTATTLSLLRQTAFGLGEAHRAGMVHRDVKPGNILVRPDGSVKITDFGIAHSARSVALTKTGQVIGTPQYLSPEQAEGRLATPASDVYALGLIGYECLTGHPAFEGDNAVTIALKQVQQDPEPLPGALPAAVRNLIGRALVKNPRARIPDGAAFVAAIDDVLAGRELPAAPATVLPPAGTVPPPRAGASTAPTRSVSRPPAPRRRSKVAMVLLPFVALLAGAGIAAAVLQALSDGPPPSTASAAEQGENGSIVLDADNYIGLPVDEVADKLTALGLTVELAREVTDEAVPDRVTDVDPEGKPLEPGDVVTVTYAVAPGDPSDGRGSAGVTGAAVGNDATEADPAPADEAVPTLEAEPTGDAVEPTLPAEPTTTAPTQPTTTAPETSDPTTTSSSAPATTTAGDASAVQ